MEFISPDSFCYKLLEGKVSCFASLDQARYSLMRNVVNFTGIKYDVSGLRVSASRPIGLSIGFCISQSIVVIERPAVLSLFEPPSIAFESKFALLAICDSAFGSCSFLEAICLPASVQTLHWVFVRL
jgi:hypothetical protein